MTEGKARIFCAVEVPETIQQHAADRISALRRAVPEARVSWERPEKMHITIKFLGEIDRSQTAAVSAAAASAASGLPPFDLVANEAGSFGKRGQPQVLWIGIGDPTGRLTTLQTQLEAECEKEGFSRDQRRFHPHLTLARIRAKEGARELEKEHNWIVWEPVQFEVSELLVIESELGPSGSHYSTVSRHSLKG
jgi:2'-5' RNA ligase